MSNVYSWVRWPICPHPLTREIPSLSSFSFPKWTLFSLNPRKCSPGWFSHRALQSCKAVPDVGTLPDSCPTIFQTSWNQLAEVSRSKICVLSDKHLLAPTSPACPTLTPFYWGVLLSQLQDRERETSALLTPIVWHVTVFAVFHTCTVA